MKSYNHLYEQYLTEENYRLGVHNATAHKGGKARKNSKAKRRVGNYERKLNKEKGSDAKCGIKIRAETA